MGHIQIAIERDDPQDDGLVFLLDEEEDRGNRVPPPHLRDW
jgi:hypothetical protein